MAARHEPETSALGLFNPGAAAALREILAATDLSTEGSAAVEHACALAARLGARLTLYHAVESIDHRFAHWSFDSAREGRAAERSAQHYLAEVADIPVPHEVVVEPTASPARSILAWIRDRRPDLAVLATHGRGGLGHFVLGSVTEEVAQQAACPVLAVHRGLAPAAYRRILVATDLSIAARSAFPMAATLARAFGAEIVATHVLPPGQPAQVPTEGFVWQVVQPYFPGLEVTAQVHEGDPGACLVQTARAEQVDLLVLARRGGESPRPRGLGRAAQQVLRHAPCPVLMV